MSNETCSKCGAETSYRGDLHCRKTLQAETRQLLLDGKIKEAEHLVFQAQFNKEWKQSLLQSLFLVPEIQQEIQKVHQQEHLVISQAQDQFKKLANKYNVDINKVVDESGPTPLAPILIKLDSKEDLDESEMEWLKNNSIFNVLATYHHRLFRSAGDVWDLAKASSNLRDARMPNKAIEISSEFLGKPVVNHKAAAAVLTSRGGAFRDLRKLSEAKKSALDAIKILPDSFHPHTLLGAVYYEEGDPSEGDKYFEKAISLGATPRVEKTEIQTILRRSDVEIRKTIVDYLLKKDPEKYAWVKQFQS